MCSPLGCILLDTVQLASNKLQSNNRHNRLLNYYYIERETYKDQFKVSCIHLSVEEEHYTVYFRNATSATDNLIVAPAVHGPGNDAI